MEEKEKKGSEKKTLTEDEIKLISYRWLISRLRGLEMARIWDEKTTAYAIQCVRNLAGKELVEKDKKEKNK